MAKQNQGKIFELSFKKSVPDYALLYRLPDSAQSFGGGNLRFSNKNPFDFLMWDSQKHKLYALEMKTVSGKSISFERDKLKTKDIHYHQIQGLNKWNRYDGITCGFIIEFRQIEKTVFIHIEDFNKIMEVIPKTSFNYNDLTEYKINYTVIEQVKVRKRFAYKIDKFLKQQ